MNHKLNGTYIMLEGLTRTEIQLASSLYKEAGMKLNNTPLKEHKALVAGIDSNSFGFYSSIDSRNREISFEELVFCSGLNPLWATHVCRLISGEYAWLETTLKDVSGKIQFIGEKTVENTTTAHEWYKAEKVASKFTVKKQDTLEPENKYEFVLKCKRTGKPVIADVYSVLKSLPQRLSPEVEHSVKKLMAAGIRNGGKSYKQDVEEARNQLNMEIEYLKLTEK